MMAGSFWLVVLGLITVDCLQNPEATRQVRNKAITSKPPIVSSTHPSVHPSVHLSIHPLIHTHIQQFFLLPVQIPAKYLPLLLYALFALFGGLRLDMACAIALGYAYGFGYVSVWLPCVR